MVDTDIPNVHNLLEVTESGFESHEFLSRIMELKRDNDRVVAWMRYTGPELNEAQRLELGQTARFLQGKNWKAVFREDGEEHAHRVGSVQDGMLECKKILQKVATS